MFPKLFIFGLLLSFSIPSWSTMLVPAYNENYCPNIDHIAPIVRSSVGDTHLFESLRLIGIVNHWNQSFVRAGDTVVANNLTPLCVGLMDDGGQPNAAAVGQQFLLMGTSLIAMLEEADGAGSAAQQLKEKFVLAHEYAHILQNLHGLKFDYVLPLLSTKIKEQHADCMASLMMGMNNEIPEDLIVDLTLFIQQLADSHIVGDHGTVEQRLSAFNHGQGIARVQKILLKNTLSTLSSSHLVRECGAYYKPTNL